MITMATMSIQFFTGLLNLRCIFLLKKLRQYLFNHVLPRKQHSSLIVLSVNHSNLHDLDYFPIFMDISSVI